MNNLTKEEIKELSGRMFVVSNLRNLSVIMPNLKLYEIHGGVDDCETESAIWKGAVGICFMNQTEKPTSFSATHSYGAPSLFKPTMYEVLSSMPQELVEKVRERQYNAVEIIYNGFTEDNKEHLSEVFLYDVGKVFMFTKDEVKEEPELNLNVLDLGYSRGNAVVLEVIKNIYKSEFSTK